MNSIPVVLNPTAGGGRMLRLRPELDARARGLGARLEYWQTEARGHAEELARRAADEGRPLVLAWGGDGTYNEVARGLAGSPTAMGVLPGGTTSVLAYEFQVPRPATKALHAMLRGVDRPMHLGRSDRDDLFLLMLSSGPDALIVRDAFRRPRRYGAKFGIAAQGLRELLGRRPLPRLRVHAGERSIEGGWVIVGNSKSFAGNYRATPAADPFAPGFDVVVHRGTGRLAATAFALGIPFGRHVKRTDVTRLVCDRVTIEPVPGDARIPYQVDGDPIEDLPVSLEVDPRQLIVRLPA